MDNYQKEIDERSNLTLSNKFELLLFKLGKDLHEEKDKLFGINVFKLREIVPMQALTKPAGMKSPLLGMVNIRDKIIPVIDLVSVVGCNPSTPLNLLLVTEYARSTQAFAVESVDNIVRLNWSQVHIAENSISNRNISSVAILDDDEHHDEIALILDVENILYDIIPSTQGGKTNKSGIHQVRLNEGAVTIIAEDSKVARLLLEDGFKQMGIPTLMYKTGLEAWNKINEIQEKSKSEGTRITDQVALVLTDLEMPEMDGFTLTRNIKSNKELKNIPVIIHSSLSGRANEEHVLNAGADGYVAKFEIKELSEVISRVLSRH